MWPVNRGVHFTPLLKAKSKKPSIGRVDKWATHGWGITGPLAEHKSTQGFKAGLQGKVYNPRTMESKLNQGKSNDMRKMIE